MPRQDNNIHQESFSVNELRRRVEEASKAALPPRSEHGSEKPRQFADFPLVKLRAISPFKGESFPPSYYDDLERVKIVQETGAGEYERSEDGYDRLRVSGSWCIDVKRSVIKKHGERTLSVLGDLLMGVCFYSVDYPENGDLPTHTIYRVRDDGRLAVASQDSFLVGCNRSANPADRIDFTFLRMAVLVMHVMHMGYEVDTHKIRIAEGDVVVDGDSPAGFTIKPADDEMVPLMKVHEPRLPSSWIADLDEFMGSRIFASEKDYWNFCMAVFYSVMGLDGAHYFIMTDTGGSGKTTMLNGLADFAAIMSTKSLQLENLAGRGFEHGMAVGQLEGKKIAIQDEVVAIKGAAMRVLNAVSSGARMDARYGSSVFKYVDVKLALWFAGNTDVDLPDIDAVRRRRVDIQLKNEMDRTEWSTAVEWDPEHRKAYKLVSSRDVFSHMFYKGMELWKDREGDFFEIARSRRDTDSSELGIVSSMTTALISEAPALADWLATNDVYSGIVVKAENMVGKPREVTSFLMNNGFTVKKSSINEIVGSQRVNKAAKWLVVDDEAAVKRIQRVIAAKRRLSNLDLREDVLDTRRLSAIMSGSATIDDCIEMVEARISSADSKLSIDDVRGTEPETRTYAAPKPLETRLSTAALVADQRGIAPAAMWNAFARRIYHAVTSAGWKHEPFVTDVPWSAVDSVDDGSRWASALGLRKMVDPETGEQFIGGMDAIDSKESISSVGMKFLGSLGY